MSGFAFAHTHWVMRSCAFDQWLVRVLVNMMQRTWGIVPLHTDMSKAALEDKVRQSVGLVQLEFHAAFLAAAIHVMQSHQDAAVPEAIATFFPSNMSLGPINMIFDDTDLEDSHGRGVRLEDSD